MQCNARFLQFSLYRAISITLHCTRYEINALILYLVQVIKFNEGMVRWQHAPLRPLSCDNADDRERESDIFVNEKVKVILVRK